MEKPIWLRIRDGEAAAEFQKILDHRGIVLNSAVAPVAYRLVGKELKRLQEDVTISKRAVKRDELFGYAIRSSSSCRVMSSRLENRSQYRSQSVYP